MSNLPKPLTKYGHVTCFYFASNFRKSYQIWGKLAEGQKVTGKKQIGGGPPPVLIGLKMMMTLINDLLTELLGLF